MRLRPAFPKPPTCRRWLSAGREVLPIVQGGMGVGVSAHRLAGAVAALGGGRHHLRVDLRRHHPDLMARDRRTAARRGPQIDAANLVALDREIARREGAGRRPRPDAVNVMRAVSDYAAYVRQACESGADAIVVGAGLPLDLPELAATTRCRADPDPVRRPRHRS